MPEHERYIPGVPCWVDTSQPDPDAAVAFYSRLFGWECEQVMPEGAPGRYAIARIRGEDVAGIGSIPEGAPAFATWNTYIWVDSADETAAAVERAGGRTLAAPFDVFDSGRSAVLADPEGAVFAIWEPRRHRGARIVNEPGAVNFNGLHTRDLEGAKRFYGAVFGWQTQSFAGSFQAWTLPAYGDHLERDRPGLREEMAQMGVPGFEDVVASLIPIGDDERDVPAHWSVTFAVADTDAIAARTAELGGRVLVPPFDAPWVRMSVLADPQGATFIASRFAPENRPDAAPDGSVVHAA